MRSSDVFRRAAEILGTPEACVSKECGWSCCAISSALGGGVAHDIHYFRLRDAFKECYLNADWWNGAKTEANQAARKAALLDMAANFEANGD
jgi:hypothetical protein